MLQDSDRFLLDLFRQSGDWSDQELSTLEYVYQRFQQTGEDLTRVLIRVKVFQRSAVQVMDMMMGGQLKPPHLSFLFQASGAATLRQSLKVEAERRIAREAAVIAGVDPGVKASGMMKAAAAVSPSRIASGSNAVVKLPSVSGSGVKSNPQFHVATIAEPPRVGSVLGKCLLTGVIGQGGNGKVFSGLHQTLNIQVAIKVLSQDGNDLSPDVIARMAREAQMLARLNHPNVIRVLDYDDNPIPFVVLEYVEGLSLADLIEQTGGLRVPRTADIIIQVARGLAAAWEVGLVHRDVKPGNVLLTKTGIAKVTDLGLAVRVGSETDPPPVNQPTGVGSPVGTCGYISPEQCVNDPTLDFRSDIYSLGATFYHAVTGRLPFVSRSTRQLLLLHMNEPVIPPHKVAPGVVDEETSAVICRMMEKNPADRYESYDELIADLIPLSQGGYAGGSTNTPGMGNLTPANVRHKTYR